MKTIVAHMSVDLDAIGSAWLIKRFLPGWSNAQLAFVPAGQTLDNKPPDKNPEIVHVDTGLGKFDHHQIFDRQISATKRVFDYLNEKDHIKNKDMESLSRLVDFITAIDHFSEAFFPDPTSDIYDFEIYQTIEGLKSILPNDADRCATGFLLLDASLNVLKNKVRAEEEIKKGLVFQSKWGKGIALETRNEEAMKLAMKMGYQLVVRKDPERKFVRIKTLPKNELNLTPVYNELKKVDPKATWFLHISTNMLINGSSKNPNVVPSSLPLKKVIEIIKKI